MSRFTGGIRFLCDIGQYCPALLVMAISVNIGAFTGAGDISYVGNRGRQSSDGAVRLLLICNQSAITSHGPFLERTEGATGRALGSKY